MRRVGQVGGIDPDHGHAKGFGADGDLGADAADADDHGGLAVELEERAESGEGVPRLGGARLDGAVDAARQAEEQGEGVIGDLRALHNFHIGDGDFAGDEFGDRGEQRFHAG